MLEKEDLDFVITLTPHNVHYEILNSAIKYNINLITEKPLARNYSEALKMKNIFCYIKQKKDIISSKYSLRLL